MVSLPLYKGPRTFISGFANYDIILLSSLISFLYQLHLAEFWGKLWMRRRTWFPSATSGGTDSTMIWAVMGGVQRVKSEAVSRSPFQSTASLDAGVEVDSIAAAGLLQLK